MARNWYGWRPHDHPGPVKDGLSFLPAVIVLSSVMFNPFLALINGNLAPLTPAVVIAAEILCVAAAHFVALSNFRPEMKPWYALLVLVTVVALLRSLALGQIEIKAFRDVLLIPTFVLLGMTFSERRLTQLIVTLHAIVLVFLVLEAFDTSSFADLFKVKDYYVNTRGYAPDSFWNPESDLFISATRPHERFFSFVEFHRLSSIFLEPVSLGNYCIIVVAFLCAFFERIGWLARSFLIVGTIVILIASDGRLATVSSAIIIAVVWIAPRLPRYSAVIYLPSILIAALIFVRFSGFAPGADDIGGRLAYTFALIGSFDVGELLAVTELKRFEAADSGLAYLILTQSLMGLASIWAFITFASANGSNRQIRFTHALCLYLSLAMLVSFSFLSIKTAALLWFIQGSLQRRPSSADRPLEFEESGNELSPGLAGGDART